MDEFRRATGGAAAGLTGLTFIVVAIRFDALAVSDEHRSRAAQTRRPTESVAVPPHLPRRASCRLASDASDRRTPLDRREHQSTARFAHSIAQVGPSRSFPLFTSSPF